MSSSAETYFFRQNLTLLSPIAMLLIRLSLRIFLCSASIMRHEMTINGHNQSDCIMSCDHIMAYLLRPRLVSER